DITRAGASASSGAGSKRVDARASSTGPEGGLRRFPDHGERCGDVLQRLALRRDTEEDRDDAAEDHRPGADDVTDEEVGAVRPVADEVAVPVGTEGAEDLGDSEEHRNGLGPNLKREDLARGQVTGARARAREEEHHGPADRLRGRV